MFPVAEITVPVTVLVALILPAAMLPFVIFAVILAPVMSPVMAALAAFTEPAATMFPPVIVPVALTLDPKLILFAVIFPDPPNALLTIRLFRLPTDVKLDETTLELNTFHVSSAALELTVNPVSKLPLPMK